MGRNKLLHLRLSVLLFGLVLFSSQTSFSAKGQDELAQLRDIHLPAPIGWWPLAPGWYLLLILVLLLGGFAAIFLGRWYLNGRARRQALALLSVFQQQYQKESNREISAARISELLKRVALTYFPREKVASLQGEDWIVFLNETSKNLNFNEVYKELLELPYQAQAEGDLDKLFHFARIWISQRRGPCLN